MLIFTSGISFSGVSEHVHLHGLDRLPLSVNDQSHLLGSFPAENLFAATRTNLCGDVFHENGLPINLKDFSDEFCAGFCRTADVTFEHGYLRLLNSIYSSWAGVAPGNNESAGKRYSGKTTKGNKALSAALNQAAHAAACTKDTYLSAQYRRLTARRGKKKAIVALEHSILVMAYHLIQRKEPYRELGSDYFDKRRPEVTAKRLVKRLETLGYSVSLQHSTALASA